MTRTVVVRVDQLRKHSKYLKFYRVSRKYKAEADDAKSFGIGDVVRIQETRPISKDKRWKVVSVVKRAPTVEEQNENAAETDAEVNE